MTKYGLAIKLSQDTGKPFTEEDAENLIDRFYEAYPVFGEYQKEKIPEIYVQFGFIALNDGWMMFGDNDNFRSVFNVGIQGAGAAIMRKAVDLAVSRGLYVCFTLHDALYIEYDVGQEHQIEILNDCMREATVWYYKDDTKEIQDYASKIRMDPFAWSPDYVEGSKYVETDGKGGLVLRNLELKVPCSNIYIDERAAKDYNAFSKYFEDREENLL